jgi:hypothetical protein
MYSQHRYILEPYNGISSRYRCPNPQCGKSKTFARYIDTTTGEQLPEEVGRCNREHNCGYHLTPKQYFEENGQAEEPLRNPSKPFVQKQRQIPKPASCVPVDAFKATLSDYSSNQLVKYLAYVFGNELTSQLISRYLIGTTAKPWPGATVFYQIDTNGGIRAGKIMLYDPKTGKRVKEPFNHVSHIHKTLNLKDYNLKQCFYGEHLLKGNSNPVAIVESEKTAIIASVYLPQFVWVATGGKNGCSWTDKNVCQALQGRSVILYPDLSKPGDKESCFESWTKKADILRGYGVRVKVSSLLEEKAHAEERTEGLDIADYLLKQNPHKTGTVKPEIVSPETLVSEIESVATVKPLNSGPIHSDSQEPKHADMPVAIPQRVISAPLNLSNLESFFSTAELPPAPILLNACEVITDPAKFIASHLQTVSRYEGGRAMYPYLNRLLQLKTLCKQMKQPIDVSKTDVISRTKEVEKFQSDPEVMYTQPRKMLVENQAKPVNIHTVQKMFKLNQCEVVSNLKKLQRITQTNGKQAPVIVNNITTSSDYWRSKYNR